MGSVDRAPPEHDQAPRRIHCETQVEIRDLAPQEPQEIIYRDILPR